jgi:outer membrane biosynthesis protein TonB
MGDVSHTVGTVLRIVTGVLVGLSALPVALNLVRARRPEFGNPQLSLTLRLWSVIGHVVAGVLIVGAAVAEIWLSLDQAGQWLFGVYGAAAAIAVLAAAAFYLAFVAETPPPPPKPLKAKKSKTPEQPASETDTETETEPADVPDEPSETEGQADEPAADEPETTVDDAPAEDEPAGGRLRNRRPSGKGRTRSRGGVAVSDD